MNLVLEHPHAVSPAEAARQLQVDPAAGLTAAEAARRMAALGPNVLEAAEPVSRWQILARQFDDLMTRILVVACAVAGGVWWLDGMRGPPSDSLVIGAIVVFNVLLGALQEARAEAAIRELERMAAASARVIRDGTQVELERGALVHGDVVLLEEGDRVPADVLLVTAERLGVDESMLTGESVAVEKRVGPVEASAPVDARAGVAFAGSTITGGRASGLVVATGARTQMGGIARSLATTHAEPTPLEKRLAALGRQIGIGVAVIAGLIAVNLLVLEGASSAAELGQILMFAVALAVAAVPEGLPTVLTVALALGARRLARDQAVVRRMSAVETLGAVTTIVTDKTGTLTRNQMTARVVHLAGRDLAVTGSGYEAKGSIADPGEARALLERAVAIGVLTGGADIEDGPAGPRALGDPTDAALVVLAAKAGVDVKRLRAETSRLAEVPFASERRRASVVVRWQGAEWLFVKGALEVLAPLAAGDAAPWHAAEERIASSGLRALALAARRLEPGETITDERGIELVALVGLGDPLRDGVPEAVAACRGAGIDVVMLTGDHPATAAAIARAAGIEPANVHARVSPQEKLRIAEELIAKGEVIAMTGDGVNDAPALKKAHVGVAMGKAGTAVAVEASAVVLMDDDFSTLVKAIRGGRAIYGAVQKFIAFLFSGNTGVVLAIFLGTALARLLDVRENGELLLPLTAAQILWMNLVTDGPPAVAFAMSPPGESTMREPPRDPRAPILDRAMWTYVLITGTTIALYLLAVIDALHAGGLFTLAAYGAVYARSAGLLAVVSARLFNALNYNVLPATLFSREGWRHGTVPLAALVSWLLTIGVIQCAPIARLFGLTGLAWDHVALVTLGGACVLCPGYLWQRYGR